MLMTQTAPWLEGLGLDHARVRDAVRALSPVDLALVVEAARSPFLGELVDTDTAGQITGPRPISETLAASGCVFSLTMSEGDYPRTHHWLTHLGWMVALHVQPGGGDWSMPVEAVDLYEAVHERHRTLTAEMSHYPTSTLGVLLYRTMRQLKMFHPGNDAEYWLLTRVTQTVLCELIDKRAEGSPLTAGGYDDAATEMLRWAVIESEDDDAAFDLADRAQMPHAYEDRHRIIRERSPF